MIHEYLNYQKEYQEKFGNNTVVFYQNGGFYEMFSDQTPSTLTELSSILDITLTRRDKSVIEISENNPEMMGFPIHALQKFLNKLLKCNYTVVVVDQVTDPPKPERKITGIYSPGVQLENKSVKSNYIGCIYLTSYYCYHTQAHMYCVGISIMDISTGNNNYCYENVNKDSDKVLDMMYQFIEKYAPTELLYYSEDIKENDEILHYLGNFCSMIHISELSPIYTKLSYQNELLGKVYPHTSFLSPIEYINLEKHPYALLCFILLIDFSYQHNEDTILNLSKPILIHENTILSLHNSTLYQLNVIENKNQSKHSQKFTSLFKVINKTKTPIGKRLLYYRLLNPITTVSELENRYDLIDIMLQNQESLYKINHHLQYVSDIERYHRKMSLVKYLHPFEFANYLDSSYKSILCITNILNEFLSITTFLEEDVLDQFKTYCSEYEKVLNIDKMSGVSLSTITESFFNPGINEEIDQIQSNIQDILIFFENEATKLSDKIKEYPSVKQNSRNSNNIVSVQKNERDGYFLVTTNTRAKYIEQKLKTERIRGYQFKRKDTNNQRIVSSEIESKSHQLIKYQNDIKCLVKEQYCMFLQEWSNNYLNVFRKISEYIAELDVIISNSKTALEYSYYRPIIEEQDYGFFDIQDLRHPIIERFDNQTVYVKNYISLNRDNIEPSGLLLYGLNYSGKSSLLKASGLSIIMAQMGMFVPGRMIYSPFTEIYTRISGDDNLFKGQSSFTVEMNDLRSMLEYSNSKSLLLADELCKGTEHASALSLVASSIQYLSKNRINFLFTTHLHELSDLSCIKELDNIKHMHLHVYSDDTGKLIYDRTLREGSGSSLYGIEVAKAIRLPADVIRNSLTIRNEYLKRSNRLVNDQFSHFNRNVYSDHCEICNKNYREVQLDVHHIKQQSESNCYGIIGDNDFHKNNLHNLVVLCKSCHTQVHQDLINILGWIETSEGKVFRYEINSVSNNLEQSNRRNKFSEDEIGIIKMYKGVETLKRAKYLLESENNIKISMSTIGKYWKNK